MAAALTWLLLTYLFMLPGVEPGTLLRAAHCAALHIGRPTAMVSDGIPILQRKKLRLREVKSLAQGHTDNT